MDNFTQNKNAIIKFFVKNPKFNAKMMAIPDMLAATSVLQQRATDIRNQKINWQSYYQ